MFDFGFSELIVIAIVALVVVGPERLPKVARTAGHLLGRLQRYVNNVKSDISREMQLDELRKLQSEMQDSARHFERSVSSEMQAVDEAVAPAVRALRDELVQIAPPQEVDGDAQPTAPGRAEATATVAAAAPLNATADAEPKA